MTSAALGAITVGPDDDPASVWERVRALAVAGGVPPLAAARLALAAVELVGSPRAPAQVEVAALTGGNAGVEVIVYGGAGRCDGPAARLADACRPHTAESGAAGQAAMVTAAPQATWPATGLPGQVLLSQAAERGGLPALLAAALQSLCDQAAREEQYRTEVSQLRDELDATSQGVLALHGELSGQRDQLAEAHAAAQRAGNAKAAFLASMSHEIRSPLNAMIGFTSLLRETRLTPEQAEYAETLAAASSHLKALVDDILDLSKVESGQLELEEVPFDLIACVEDAAGIVASQAEDKDLALATLTAPGVPAIVAGDPLRLRQVLVNLLSNAVKFTDHGQVTVEVGTMPGAGEGECRVIFDVHDTGPGIPAGSLGKLFDPFTQADASTARRFGGTGLGLAICKQLTDRMGGQLSVESTPGRGTTFTAAIPFRQVPPAAAGAPQDQPLTGVHVLLVHPQPAVAEAARRHLAAWGAAITVAASAADAAGRGTEWADAALAVVGTSPPAGLPAMIDVLTTARDGHPLPVVALVPLAWHLAAPPLALPWTVTATPIRRARLREAVLGALGYLDPSRSEPRAAPTAGSARALRILVAEDDPANQRAITGLLHRLGHRTDLASDGEQAVVAITGGDYDLVLMDVHMPRLDGIAATREARAQRPGSHPPIIALTASATPGTRQACLRAGMNGFLAKPLQPADLAGLITATVEHHTPAAAPPAGDQPASAQLAHQPPATRTVLYIDDNAALRGLAERILSKDPAITVLTAADADTGLAQAAAHQPDLILLDLHLHGSHGEALISSLRSGERTSTIPVIAVSGDTSPATVKRLTSLGVTAYLSKPFDAERLRAIVTATATQRPTGTAAAPGPA